MHATIMAVFGMFFSAVTVLLLAENYIAETRKAVCPSKMSLATFNTALAPIYPGVNGAEIEERTQLLIQQVV